MALREYLKRVLDEKNLSAREVAKRSEGGIGHAAVSNILAGKMPRPSLRTLKGLAKGIGEPQKVVINEAGEIGDDDEWDGRSLARAITKIVSSRDLTSAVRLLLTYNPREVKAALPDLEEALSNAKSAPPVRDAATKRARR